MSMMATFDGKNPNDFRMVITPEYLEGRKANREGKKWLDSCPFSDFHQRLDFWVGWHDENDGVSVEQRAEAERVGESFAA